MAMLRIRTKDRRILDVDLGPGVARFHNYVAQRKRIDDLQSLTNARMMARHAIGKDMRASWEMITSGKR